jgi:predicted RNA methylase
MHLGSRTEVVNKLTWRLMKRYRVSRALTLAFDEDGDLVAHTSLSRPPLDLNSDALEILSGFAQSATADEVFDGLRERFDIERDDFEAALEVLVAENAVTPEDESAFMGALSGFADLKQHRAMLADTNRTLAYRAAIERAARGKIVAEIGCGVGVLSMLAAKAGAKHVYAIEEAAVGDLAATMIAANGLSDRVTVVRGNSRDVTLPQKADVIVHELIGMHALDENVMPTMADARARLLARGGRLIPERLRILCRGVALAPDHPASRTLLRREMGELSDAYGIDMSPFEHELELDRNEGVYVNAVTPSPTPMTDEVCLMELVFARLTTPAETGTVQLKATAAGEIHGVALYFDAPLDADAALSGSPWTTAKMHWGWELFPLEGDGVVRPGDAVELTYRLGSADGRQHIEIRAKRQS